MVNIIDNIQNVATDRYAFVKIFILAIPAIIMTYAQLSGQSLVANTVNILFSILFGAIFFETVRRSCNAEPMLLPSFLVPRMFVTLGFSLLASILAIAICFGLFLGYGSLIAKNPQIVSTPISMYLVSGAFGLLGTSIYFASVTQYLDSGKLFDAYNPVKILKALKTFIVNLLFFVIFDAIFATILVIPAIGVFIISGNEPNFFFIAYLSMAAIFNYLVFADYIGQTKKDSESPYERLF